MNDLSTTLDRSESAVNGDRNDERRVKGARSAASVQRLEQCVFVRATHFQAGAILEEDFTVAALLQLEPFDLRQRDQAGPVHALEGVGRESHLHRMHRFAHQKLLPGRVNR